MLTKNLSNKNGFASSVNTVDHGFQQELWLLKIKPVEKMNTCSGICSKSLTSTNEPRSEIDHFFVILSLLMMPCQA